MIFFIIMLLIFFIALLFIKLRCPECGGKLDDIYVNDGHIVYKCRNCGEEWV